MSGKNFLTVSSNVVAAACWAFAASSLAPLFLCFLSALAFYVFSQVRSNRTRLSEKITDVSNTNNSENRDQTLAPIECCMDTSQGTEVGVNPYAQERNLLDETNHVGDSDDVEGPSAGASYLSFMGICGEADDVEDGSEDEESGAVDRNYNYSKNHLNGSQRSRMRIKSSIKKKRGVKKKVR